MRITVLSFLFMSVALQGLSQKKEDLKRTMPQYGFIENRGQIKSQDNNLRSDVKFVLSLPNNNVLLTSKGFSYDTYITEEKKIRKHHKDNHNSLIEDDSLVKEFLFKFHRVDIEFDGANIEPEIITEDPAKDYINYYEDGKVIEVRHFGKVLYKNIYPGIDVEFVARPGKNKPIEYNFIVHQGADMDLIRLKYKGAHSNRISKDKIELNLEYGILTESIPLSYGKASKKNFSVNYKEIKKNKTQSPTKEMVIGFSGNVRGIKEDLIIDPTPSIIWGTYYGGTKDEKAYALTIDASKNVIITGYTTSISGVATTDGFQSDYRGNTDAFVAKFSEAGVLKWATYFGNTGREEGRDVVHDIDGNIYVAGFTSSSTGISYQTKFLSNHNGVLTNASLTDNGLIFKLSSTGALLWSTYYYSPLNGESCDLEGICIGKSGDIYVVGESESDVDTRGSVARFDNSGFMKWQAAFGEGNRGRAFSEDIQTDSDEAIVITGFTTKKSGIATALSEQPIAPPGDNDAFLMKFSKEGEKKWGTYYGGDGADYGFSLAVDSQNNIYIAGRTSSNNLIASDNAYQTLLKGSDDAFIAKFNSTGRRQWGTYYGGELSDLATGITLTPADELIVVGNTSSKSGIVTPDAYKCSLNDASDSFILKLNTNGFRVWATYFGNGITDITYDVDIIDNTIYLGGYTFYQFNDTQYITTPGSHKSAMEVVVYSDAFLSKFDISVQPCLPPGFSDLSLDSKTYLCATNFFINGLNNCIPIFTWNFGDGIVSNEKSPLHVYNNPGTYNVSVTLFYNACTTYNLTKQINVNASGVVEFSPNIIQSETDTKNQILSVSAVTFSDVWPLSHDNASLSNKSSYINGSQGVWRNNASYVYNVPRQLSPVTNVAKDGTFSLIQFDWATAPLNIVPNWIEANSMTKYSPYSYELENQDVLGVYSAALYDYGGHLPSANGVNMRHAEMGFTSFEYKDSFEPEDQKGKPSGNWMLSNIAQSATLRYKIPIGTAYMAVVDASMEELDLVQKVDVAASGIQPGLFFLAGRRPFNFLQDVPILCKQVHPTDPTKSIIVLARAPFDGLWTGSITVKRTAFPAVAGNFDNQVAHSGKNSLKIVTSQTFRQEMFQLEAGKSYWINAWVSIAQPNLPTPLLANGIGIEIALKNKQGQEVGKFFFEPVGTIIEGWQQIKGTFVSPIKNPLLEITFKPGSGGITAWYDDLRLQPEEGNMKAYVYDLNDYRLHAILDEENYASFFYYDTEGNLYLTKKETEKGIKTISENISYQVEKDRNE